MQARHRTPASSPRLRGNTQPSRSPIGARVWWTPKVWLTLIAIVVLASCERVPSKSDYVSARVTEMCKGRSGDELRACRIAVIKQFTDMPLEEMQRRFPKPEPRARPSC